jgi:hypothetical protein
LDHTQPQETKVFLVPARAGAAFFAKKTAEALAKPRLRGCFPGFGPLYDLPASPLVLFL